MLILLARHALLVFCTASAFLVLGRAPGAVNLRTREIEREIASDRKVGRDLKPRYAWLGDAKA